MGLNVARRGAELNEGLHVCYQCAAGVVAVGLDYVTCGECAVKRHHYAGAAAVVGDDGAVVQAVARVEAYVAVAEVELAFREVAVIELVAVIIARHVHALYEIVAQAGVLAGDRVHLYEIHLCLI